MPAAPKAPAPKAPTAKPPGTAGAKPTPGKAASDVGAMRKQGADDAAVREHLTAAGYPPAAVERAVKAKPAPSAEPVSEPAPPAAEETASGGGLSLPSVPTFSAPNLGSGSLASFALGAVGCAVLINFMHGGPMQVKAWASAKFLNKITAAALPTVPGAPGDAEKRQKASM